MREAGVFALGAFYSILIGMYVVDLLDTYLHVVILSFWLFMPHDGFHVANSFVDEMFLRIPT